MSASICRRCFGLFKHKQMVSFVGTAEYQLLKSEIVYALDPTTMSIDEDTLVHGSIEDCENDYSEGELEDEEPL